MSCSELGSQVANAYPPQILHMGVRCVSTFGDYKQPGDGREGGEMGLYDYLATKTLYGLIGG